MNNQQNSVLGHPAGLFVLFFTEMWERFSYYGMRALLVLFLVSGLQEGGWAWEREDALQLYGIYTGLVYVTPIFGGLIADKVLGYRRAVLLGALLMTLGHGAMAFETKPFFYLGLTLLILGNGFFKPNISSIVGGLYAKGSDKRDAAYTIFYMGINAGAFLGILLCGYIGEKVGWSWGFGLAGIFMFFGMLQFWFGQQILGIVGLAPKKKSKDYNEILKEVKAEQEEQDSIADFDTTAEIQKIEVALPGISEEQKKSVLKEVKRRFFNVITNDRLIVIAIFSFFTIFFWMAFEQAGGSMTIFAKDYTERILIGDAATTFKWVNAILTVGPLAIVTWVLFKLFSKTFKKYSLSNIFLGISFVIIWGISLWMLKKEFDTKAYKVAYSHTKEVSFNDTVTLNGKINKEMIISTIQKASLFKDSILDVKLISMKKVEGNKYTIEGSYKTAGQDTSTLSTDEELNLNSNISIIKSDDRVKYIDESQKSNYPDSLKGTVVEQITNQTEVPASWFGILNSFFIIAFAPLFSKIWESKANPSGPVKFALGLILLGLGFAVLAFGGLDIAKGAKGASVSMVWLILAYLLHTLGELCVSPVGLSYVSKLAPMKLVGLMFGIWFGATAIANYLAGWTGSLIDKISETYSLSTFFMIYTLLPIGAGLILIFIRGWLRKKMHGIQ